MKVTDAEGASDEATASIVVEEEKDYPPTANAGEDIIIYLPTTEARLHGNQSTDDHGIETWEWTRKSPPEGGRDLAADSTNMRTAHPVLTNLEEGTYTFILKVTDAKGQSRLETRRAIGGLLHPHFLLPLFFLYSTDEVNVYVKPAINLPPTANAGKDIVSLFTYLKVEDIVSLFTYLRVKGENISFFLTVHIITAHLDRLGRQWQQR
jgi:hypothetical protein